MGFSSSIHSIDEFHDDSDDDKRSKDDGANQDRHDRCTDFCLREVHLPNCPVDAAAHELMPVDAARRPHGTERVSLPPVPCGVNPSYSYPRTPRLVCTSHLGGGERMRARQNFGSPDQNMYIALLSR